MKGTLKISLKTGGLHESSIEFQQALVDNFNRLKRESKDQKSNDDQLTVDDILTTPAL